MISTYDDSYANVTTLALVKYYNIFAVWTKRNEKNRNPLFHPLFALIFLCFYKSNCIEHLHCKISFMYLSLMILIAKLLETIPSVRQCLIVASN